MTHPASKHDKYSYADYQSWNNGRRWEIINGDVFDMTPAPNTKHQRILLRLSRIIIDFLKKKPCEVFITPFDVRFAKPGTDETEIYDVVQPDISVFCDKKKIDEKGALGAPDWVFEILSPHTSRKDLSHKLMLYLHNEVKEYWIIDPDDEIISVFVLDKHKKFSPGREFNNKSLIPVAVFQGIKIKAADIFNS